MRRVSLADVAKAAGVAKATASRALSAQQHDVGAATRARIQEVAADLGYRPNRAAQSLRTGRRQLLGAVVPAGATGWEPVLRGAAEQARKRGYHLVLHTVGTGFDATRLAADLTELTIDGVLLIGLGRALPAPSREDGQPLSTVLVDEELTHADGTIVRTALWNAGRTAARHLLDEGRTAPAVLAPLESTESTTALTQGFRDTCAEAGHPVPDDRILGIDPAATGGLESFLRPVDGLFACTGLLAVTALRTLRRMDVAVPRSASVIAYGDGDLLRHADPPLTVLRLPHETLGARAADVLVDTIEQVIAPPVMVELAAELVVRGSSAP
ncbi:LacI family transcriptional regulator [Amycolatopsis sp. NBC_00345]|uniref:LacI family DNA-binding transcriptional regulator n=1 Tax=Amycolatopsis sp. NBC_00345 TaxID=2975955 RepID=UPI002E258FAF